MVHNYSFEQSTACPLDTNKISFASEWFPAGAGADYFDSCCNNCSVDVPLNYMGYQDAFPGGHAYAGFYYYKEYSPNFRGYIGGALDPLIIGHYYRVTIHICGSSQMQYGCDGPEAFFYINQTIPATNQVLQITPQINFQSVVAEDTIDWYYPNKILYADSAYTKILIGNFKDDAHSNVRTNLFQYPLTPQAHAAYGYIDEISVVDITAAYLAGLEEEQQTVTAYPNPLTEYATFSFSNPQAQPHTLAVYNMQGMQVRTIGDITSNEVVFKRDDLPAGYYFYRLSNTASAVATGKLLIQ